MASHLRAAFPLASLALFLLALGQALGQAPLVSTLAGGLGNALVDGVGSAAAFFYPAGVIVAADGTVYVADSFNNVVRTVTPAGVVRTLAGTNNTDICISADGVGRAASFCRPWGVALDANGTLFVTDYLTGALRRVDAQGNVSTVALHKGTGEPASLKGPMGLAIDPAGTIYIAEKDGATVSRVSADGVLSVFAGSGVAYQALDGIGTAASFKGPCACSPTTPSENGSACNRIRNGRRFLSPLADRPLPTPCRPHSCAVPSAQACSAPISCSQRCAAACSENQP